MAQSQDGRDTVQEWVHKQKKETKKRKGKKTKEKELGLGLPVTRAFPRHRRYFKPGPAPAEVCDAPGWEWHLCTAFHNTTREPA